MGSFQLAKEVFDKLPTYYVGVVIAEELRIKSDDIVYIAVGHHHSIILAKYIVPGTYG